MTVYELLRETVGIYQQISITDYSNENEEGPYTVYEGLCWQCPYSEEKHKQNHYSKAKVDGIEAEDNTIIISIGIELPK